jgi:hypothetical protein
MIINLSETDNHHKVKAGKLSTMEKLIMFVKCLSGDAGQQAAPLPTTGFSVFGFRGEGGGFCR